MSNDITDDAAKTFIPKVVDETYLRSRQSSEHDAHSRLVVRCHQDYPICSMSHCGYVAPKLAGATEALKS